MLKTKAFLIIGCLLTLVSCYEVEKPEQPKTLLSEDEMVNILIDMSIMSSAKGVNKKRLENSGIKPEQYIYSKHNIDSLVFAENNNYYAFDLDSYDKIYKRVKDSLTEFKKKAEDKTRRSEEEIKRVKELKLNKKKLTKGDLKSNIKL